MKMVRKAYGMAILEKKRNFTKKNNEKNKKVLELGREKNAEAASIPFCCIFQDKSIGDKLRSQNLV